MVGSPAASVYSVSGVGTGLGVDHELAHVAGAERLEVGRGGAAAFAPAASAAYSRAAAREVRRARCRAGGMADTTGSNAMWGGRFASGPDAVMEAINASIDFDRRLYAEDIAASRAHAAMLGATGIVSDTDAAAIREGLLTVLSEIEAGGFPFSRALEDIHMNVESRLRELIGAPAGRLHTARSRNDQVATDFRLWVRGQCDAVDASAGGADAGAGGAGGGGGRRW